MKNVLHLIIVLFVSLQIHAQQKEITGTITDESGLPLPGVNINVKGTSNGVNTNFEGLYTISANVGDVLTYSFVGFIIEEKTVGELNTISFSMKADQSALEEVVITSYRNSSKKYRAPSAAQIKRRKQRQYHNTLSTKLNSSTTQILAGKSTGVNIKKGKSNPNSKIIIRGVNSIKGNNKPLVVVDGKISNYNAMEKLNPKQIKNINILKDAGATAIYENSGSDGVIIISTKNKKLKTSKELLYIVDGVPIKKEHNYIIESIPVSDIDNKRIIGKADAKSKFGNSAKNGCVIITTHKGDFRLEQQESYAVINENNYC